MPSKAALKQSAALEPGLLNLVWASGRKPLWIKIRDIYVHTYTYIYTICIMYKGVVQTDMLMYIHTLFLYRGTIAEQIEEAGLIDSSTKARATASAMRREAQEEATPSWGFEGELSAISAFDP